MGVGYEAAKYDAKSFASCCGGFDYLLIVAGVPTKTDTNPSSESLLWLISLQICIGTVFLRVSKQKKPLDWVIVGSFLGATICLCAVLGIGENVFCAVLLFCLYLLTLMLSSTYRIAQYFGIFD